MLRILLYLELMPWPTMQVEQLSKDMHRQQGVTISMAHNKGCVPSSAHACRHFFLTEEDSMGCEKPT